MKQPKDTVQMITKAHLKSVRGWTDCIIRAFLPNPDLTKPNPHYKSGPPMQLFKTDRIDAIEKTKEFKALQADAIKRQEAAKRAVATKRRQLHDYLDTITVSVPALPRQQLIKQACEHYNSMQDRRVQEGRPTSGWLATADSDCEFIERICVNYLRHCLTKYEKHLAAMSGKVGVDDGYEEVRRKIFSAISEKHIWLAAECRRQQDREE